MNKPGMFATWGAVALCGARVCLMLAALFAAIHAAQWLHQIAEKAK